MLHVRVLFGLRRKGALGACFAITNLLRGGRFAVRGVLRFLQALRGLALRATGDLRAWFSGDLGCTNSVADFAAKFGAPGVAERRSNEDDKSLCCDSHFYPSPHKHECSRR